ncbi:RnfH family protein [Massilia sp. CCM 8734]|uniref:RnfH family protein n=1 Tax=Massilia sp. CCM 8734 TaxID=2609283 RepID=UPI00141E4A9F|nr:RnfH family protein [Massilia sp. CCM 8734]NHZ94152.1 RnfH family protein [Massilia sp. CCM 8734]
MVDSVADAKADPAGGKFTVQVCYATPLREYLHALTVEQGCTIEQAIIRSGVLEAIPGIDLALQPVGLYGKKKPLDTVLRPRDRIEIYRPLVADPKESRRKRAEKKAQPT